MKKLLLFVFAAVMFTGLNFAGSITVNSPNGGENLNRGSRFNVLWNGTGLSNPVKITLWKNDVLVGLIVKDQPAHGSYNWIVGKYRGGTANPGTGFKIKIREQGGADFQTEDISNSSFEITRKTGLTLAHENITELSRIRIRPDSQLRRILVDYEITEIKYSNGYVQVRVKSKLGATNGKVSIKYEVQIPYNETNTITKQVNIPKDKERWIPLFRKSIEDFPCSMRIRAIVNPKRVFIESNFNNNEKTETIYSTSGVNGKIVSVTIDGVNIENGGNISFPVTTEGRIPFPKINVTKSIQVTVKNCGQKEIKNAKIRIDQLFHSYGSECTSFDKEIGSYNINNIKSTPRIKLLRNISFQLQSNNIASMCQTRENKVTIYFDSGDKSSLNTDNTLTFTINKK